MDDTDKNYFELKKHSTAQMPLKLYEGELTAYKDCYIHWHNEYEIIYVLSGSTRVTINEKVIIGKKGDLVFINKDELHHIERLDEDKQIFRYRTLVFDVGFLSCGTNVIQQHYIRPLIDKKVLFDSCIRPEFKNYESIKQSYLNVLTAYKMNNIYSGLQIISNLYELIYEMYCSEYVHKNKENNLKYDETIKCVMAYINEHYSENINITVLAQQVGFSECYFMHIFKKYTGISVIDYLNNFRMNMAVDKLLNSDGTVQDIAMDVGFWSTSYFIKLFKKKYDITPLQYRKIKKAE